MYTYTYIYIYIYIDILPDPGILTRADFHAAWPHGVLRIPRGPNSAKESLAAKLTEFV